MAEEYLHAGNYQMAKRFFERIVQPYQKEGWWLVLASVQRSLLTCAIHLGQVLVANRKRPGHVRGGGGGGGEFTRQERVSLTNFRLPAAARFRRVLRRAPIRAPVRCRCRCSLSPLAPGARAPAASR